MYILIVLGILILVFLSLYFEYLDRVRSPVSTEVVDKKAFIARFNSPLEDLVNDGVVRFRRHHTAYRTYKHVCHGLIIILSVVGILTVLAGCSTTRTTRSAYSIVLDSVEYRFGYDLTETVKSKKNR